MATYYGEIVFMKIHPEDYIDDHGKFTVTDKVDLLNIIINYILFINNCFTLANDIVTAVCCHKQYFSCTTSS